MLSADTPIERATDDRLQRTPFARSLANDIRDAPRDSGFVVGLTGPWGDGKTSVLRLVEDQLGEADATTVVRFNPWLFSGTEQLVEHFFDELSGQLESTDTDRLRGVAGALRSYGRIVAPLRYVPYLSEIARVSSEVAGDLSQALAGGQSPPSARQRGKQLAEQLAALEQPIVVMVDDLDRLRDEEIVDVVRLVRLVGDFPNLVYVMAFDRPVVERSLGGGDRVKGRAYLDKIVHLSHELPRIRPEDLTQIIEEAISAAIEDQSDYYLDRERLTNVFWAGVRQLFATVRDVRRYANVLPSALRQLGDEVALADILALEAIRLFEPECFEAIVEARDSLTMPRAMLTMGGSSATEHENQVKAIPALASAGRQEAVEEVLRRLFPLAESALGGPAYSESFLPEWRGERRVASAEVFSVYLHKRLPPGALPARDVERAVRLLDDERELDEYFASLADEELEGLLTRLVEYEPKFPAARAEVAISVILRHRGRLRHEVSFNDFGGDMAASRVVYRLLRGRGAEETAELVKRIEFCDLSGRYDVVRMVGYREGSGHRLVAEDDAAKLEGDLAEAILATAPAQLAAERDLGPLIAFLARERDAELRGRLADWIADDRFLVRLVGAHRRTSLSNTVGEAAVRRTVQLDWPRLTALVDLASLRKRLAEIDLDWVEGEANDDTLTVWRQALRYADDPDAAARETRRFHDGDEEEDPTDRDVTPAAM